MQATIVTETKGLPKGRRVVRGREAECASHPVSASQDMQVMGKDLIGIKPASFSAWLLIL